eukprot:6002219-Amphidinium_carterae.1
MLPVFDLVNHDLPLPQRRLKDSSAVERHYKKSLGKYGMRPTTGGEKQLQLWVTRALTPGEEITD